jgi:hypothetical protein
MPQAEPTTPGDFMKFLFLSLLTTLSLGAMAQAPLVKEIFRQTSEIEVQLDETTVRCSNIGYGFPELKVDVPALDLVATFQHRNFGEGQPCMTAGRCTPDRSPELLLATGPGIEKAQLEVVHTEEAYLNEENNTCYRSLVETVTMQLRGQTFTHRRSGVLSETTADQCKAILQ